MKPFERKVTRAAGGGNQPRRDVRPMSRRRMLHLLGAGGMALAMSPVRGFQQRAEAARSRPRLLSTRLTQDYGLDFPFVGAGMGFVALPELVAAVSNAGGLGVLGNGPEPPPATAFRIDQIRALTDRPFGVDFFLATSPLFGPVTVSDHIDVAIAKDVPLVVFHFDIPPAEWVERLHNAGIAVWVQVPSVVDALASVDVGADALIAQGAEAGGHNKSTLPLKHLLRDLLDEVDVPVLAAGGIATGADVVEALAHGAEGVWVGSRLLASEEAYAHAEYKRRLTEAAERDTVITKLFGPELPCLPYRVLRNRVVNEFLDIEDDLCGLPPDFSNPIGTTVLFPGTPFQTETPLPKRTVLIPTPDTMADMDDMGLAAGESVHKIDRVKPVAQIIEDMRTEARQIIGRGAGPHTHVVFDLANSFSQ
jgi:NAD(P)H-dependent flavin oxidoreductase YrpB (nitropropane dioxygenase family)